MQSRRLGQRTIFYRTMGQGEPLLLLHGLSGSFRWWRRNIFHLAHSYQLYLIDVPGFGRRKADQHGFDLDSIAASLVEWMDLLDIKQAHLLGHSMGGYLCLWIAAHHPARLKRLVLVSPASFFQNPSFGSSIVPLLLTICTLKPSFFPLLVADALRAGPRVIVQAAHDLFTKDIRASLPEISAPTLLIWGTHDVLVPPVIGEILRDLMPDARLLLLEKAGHVAMFDQADQFNQAVLAFLAGEPVGA